MFSLLNPNCFLSLFICFSQLHLRAYMSIMCSPHNQFSFVFPPGCWTSLFIRNRSFRQEGDSQSEISQCISMTSHPRLTLHTFLSLLRGRGHPFVFGYRKRQNIFTASRALRNTIAKTWIEKIVCKHHLMFRFETSHLIIIIWFIR